jgi:sigma-E factor negative regulatory protein RseC
MATEEGIVIRIGGQSARKAWVKTVQSGACKSCSARHSCNPESMGKEREVEAINMVDAQIGDLIQISIDSGALLKATFLLYVFPIICMLIGGLAGHVAGLRLGMNPSPTSAAVAVVCFTASLLVVRRRANRMALQMQYRPKITRIISRAKEQHPAAPGNPAACGHPAASNT